MKPSIVLVVVGGVLVVGAALGLVSILGLPFEHDTDYAYEVGDPHCAEYVSEPPSPREPDDFRVDYANLSPTARQYFERALADGRYVVENEEDVPPDFGFPFHTGGRGEDCYAVNYSGETYALGTRRVRHQAKLAGLSFRWLFLAGGTVFVVGAVLAGVGLGIRDS